MSDLERKHWVEAMGGTWPPSQNSLQRMMRADSVEENLNGAAFAFLKDCIAELEARGLREQGLYRVGGVLSKVKKLLSIGLDEHHKEPLDLSDPKAWESKTIASAIKKCFADLQKPLLTHQLYGPFLEAAKKESETERLQAVGDVIRQLPPSSREILR